MLWWPSKVCMASAHVYMHLKVYTQDVQPRNCCRGYSIQTYMKTQQNTLEWIQCHIQYSTQRQTSTQQQKERIQYGHNGYSALSTHSIGGTAFVLYVSCASAMEPNFCGEHFVAELNQSETVAQLLSLTTYFTRFSATYKRLHTPVYQVILHSLCSYTSMSGIMMAMMDQLPCAVTLRQVCQWQDRTIFSQTKISYSL